MRASDFSMAMQGLHLQVAQGFWARLGGLLALPVLRDDQALLLAPCNSVHTAFMRYAIDVVFLDKQGRALKVVSHLQAWRMAACWGAASTLELRAGQASRWRIQPGAQVITRAANRPAP